MTAPTLPDPTPAWWELCWLDGAFRHRAPTPQTTLFPGAWQRPLPAGVHPLAHHLGQGGTVLWTDGTLLPGVGDHTLPILSREWLSTVAHLRAPHPHAHATRHLRQDLLHTAQRHPDPTWSAPWTERGLTLQEARVGLWTLIRAQLGLRHLIFPEHVPTWAEDALSTRPVHVWTGREHGPVLLWPHARPLDDLLTTLRAGPADETPEDAARRAATTLTLTLTHDIDTPDVIRLQETP